MFQVCLNGKIQVNYEFSIRYPRKFGPFRSLRNRAIIAPFWAMINENQAFKDGHSKVYYHAYERSRQDTPQTSNILSMASRDVRSYADNDKFSNFNATWVLVVTWVDLCPYVDTTELYCYWVSIHFTLTSDLLLVYI